MSNVVEPVTYQTVLNSVRPPRAVTLICSGGNWRADTLRMLECSNATRVPGAGTDLIETWVSYKREREVDPIRPRPTPHEFELYFDL